MWEPDHTRQGRRKICFQWKELQRPPSHRSPGSQQKPRALNRSPGLSQQKARALSTEGQAPLIRRLPERLQQVLTSPLRITGTPSQENSSPAPTSPRRAGPLQLLPSPSLKNQKRGTHGLLGAHKDHETHAVHLRHTSAWTARQAHRTNPPTPPHCIKGLKLLITLTRKGVEDFGLRPF